jgi:hypothetical protein
MLTSLTWIITITTSQKASMLTSYTFTPSVISYNCILNWAKIQQFYDVRWLQAIVILVEIILQEVNLRELKPLVYCNYFYSVCEL